MPVEELEREIAAGVVFWGYEADGALLGIMGIQRVRDVELIRHAYVLPAAQGNGVGGALLEHLLRASARPVLVGTWAAAQWAIGFYRRHGFELASPERKTELLREHLDYPRASDRYLGRPDRAVGVRRPRAEARRRRAAGCSAAPLDVGAVDVDRDRGLVAAGGHRVDVLFEGRHERLDVARDARGCCRRLRHVPPPTRPGGSAPRARRRGRRRRCTRTRGRGSACAGPGARRGRRPTAAGRARRAGGAGGSGRSRAAVGGREPAVLREELARGARRSRAAPRRAARRRPRRRQMLGCQRWLSALGNGAGATRRLGLGGGWCRDQGEGRRAWVRETALRGGLDGSRVVAVDPLDRPDREVRPAARHRLVARALLRPVGQVEARLVQGRQRLDARVRGSRSRS